jgi:TolB protein
MNKVLILLLLVFGNSHALLKIDINKYGVQSIPIAVAEFSGEKNDLASIIINNLKNSGHFKVKKLEALSKNIDFSKFKDKKVEAVVYGSVKKNKTGFEVEFFVYDIWTKKVILSKSIELGNKIIRRVAHVISDKVHFSLLGEDGFYDTNIAYVSFEKNRRLPYKLEIVESDGNNPQVILESKEPIMSPSWSPDSKSLAYVSFASGRSKVYIQNIFTKDSLKVLPIFDGISSSPSWHPDGNSLLVTISKNGNQDIYRYFLNGELERLTKHSAIDTEASFSPDGKSIVWTSNRGGSVSIYIKKLNSNNITKLNIAGSYNANPSFSPNGKKILLIHGSLGYYKIAEYEISTEDLVELTYNSLDESPSFAPNGKMIIYSYNKNNKSYLATISSNGLFGFKLSDGSKQIREPVWSNFL